MVMFGEKGSKTTEATAVAVYENWSMEPPFWHISKIPWYKG